MRACAVWPVIVAAAVISLLLGCHGSGGQDALFGPPDRGSSVAGVWKLFALGPSFQGPWYSAQETGSSGTWDIAQAGEPIRSVQLGDETGGTWSRTLKLPNRPTENSSGSWGMDLRTGYYFKDAGGKTTSFYLQDGRLYYAIQEPGVFTGVVVWERK